MMITGESSSCVGRHMSHNGNCSWIWPVWMSESSYGSHCDCNGLQSGYCHLLLFPWRLPFIWESHVGGERAFSPLHASWALLTKTLGIAMSLHAFLSILLIFFIQEDRNNLSLLLSHISLGQGPRRLPLQKHKYYIENIMFSNTYDDLMVDSLGVTISIYGLSHGISKWDALQGHV